ncbi:MAG: cytochrome c [Gemmatimonadota bacterium]|jgi:mono/diheme cytochrome c family protein
MQRRDATYGSRRFVLLSFGLGVAASLCAATAAGAQETPTFTEDVAPILFESCARCHQPDGIGPMSLLTYGEARRYARRIREKVSTRQMPPWHLDRTVGIQRYKNDISLTDRDIETIVAWVDAGTPEGDPYALPPLPELPDGSEYALTSVLGPPDFVVKSTPYTVEANAQDQWWTPTVPFEGIIDEPRYVRATEMKGSYPLGVRVLHHGHAQLVMLDDKGQRVVRPLGRQGVGKGGDLFPENTGMLIRPEGQIMWNLHYFPIDEVVADEQAEAAVWLYPKGYVPELETVGEQRFTADMGGDMPWAGDIVIPPHSVKVQQGVHVLDQPALMSSFRPHMHMRGRAQSVEAIYPDGRREMLGRVDKYNHFWQISYEFEDDVAPLLPRGTVLLITTTWDNTANNPVNPDPRQWVVFGQRGVDEMSHVWLGMTYLTDEQFAVLSARRSRMARAGDDD